MQDTYVPPPPKKSKTGLLIGIIVLALLICCAGPLGITWYGFTFAKKNKGFVACTMSMRMAQMALMRYAESNASKLPPAEGWQKAIQPYVKKNDQEGQEMIGRMLGSPVGTDTCQREGMTTYITYNANAAGKTIAELESSAQPYLLFEAQKAAPGSVAPYAPQPIDQAPTMMGGVKAWLVVEPNGEVKPVTK